MNTLNNLTKALYYQVHKGTAKGIDYLYWAVCMVELEQESNSLLKLMSMDKNESVFVFEEYFNRILNELNITIPDFEDCAREIIRQLCLEIINGNKNIFEITKKIFKVTSELDYPIDLSVWNGLDDGVDRITYDDEYYKPDETELRNEIEIEARMFLAAQADEDIR
ncbi:hypothetical protein [Paenibacillus xylanexedens]|uniref:hypothetical protein n=1 Tax=Paenibacillus xylanexedens TaxID=528191 RepID=UPI00119E8693|nr:hypothetical protein [Paenibacillus xylanexedens]